MTHHTHDLHQHEHGPGCGHVAVAHDGHTDYLHDGHLHHAHGDHYDEHAVAVSGANPEACAPMADHHAHGPGCGHEPVPHGEHTDYLVDGRLHHPHGGAHCDDHGALALA